MSLLLLIFIGIPINIMSQSRQTQLDEAINMALENNQELLASRLRVEQSRRQIGEAFDISPTDIYYNYDANNIAANNIPLKVFGIAQSLSFPGVYLSQRKTLKTQTSIQQMMFEICRQNLIKSVSQQYISVVVLLHKLKHYERLDSLYNDFTRAAEISFEVGETNSLEALTSRAKVMQIEEVCDQLREDIHEAISQLNALVQADSAITVPEQDIQPLAFLEPDLSANSGVMMQAELQQLAINNISVERNRLMPGVSIGYFLGTNDGDQAKLYPGYQIGLSIPVWFGAQQARIQAAKVEGEISKAEAAHYNTSLQARQDQLMREIRKFNIAIQNYQYYGKQMAGEISDYARRAYDNREIDFFRYIQSLEDAGNIELNYLENLDNYNQAVLEYNYLN